jgi:hypothetical protein
MLEEIFEKLSEEVTEACKPVSKKMNVGFGINGSGKTASVSIELLNFTPDFAGKNLPSAPPALSTYGFCFYIISRHNDYLKLLRLTELISGHFEQKPFMQWAIGGKEYEMAISSMEVSIEVINQFWIARKEPHQPVLFYKARVSDI